MRTKGQQRDVVSRTLRLPAEWMLMAAIVTQLLTDAQSPHPGIREEARRFLSRRTHVQYWDDFLALDGRLLREAAALVEADRR